MNDQELRDLQLNLLEILKYIDKICKKNKLRYYLIYGSCIGAIRHNGFIPWDDDLDIAMPLEDYEKFCSILKGSKNKKYFLQTRETDKNYYLEDKNFLNIDYDYIYSVMEKEENIDIRTLLSLEDYYETDTHWKQEKLDKVVEKLVTSMGHTYKKVDYKYNTYDKFYGVYYGESAVNREPEKIIYLTNELVDNAEVKYLENDELTSIYNIDKLSGLDAYEVYLDGASSFIEIINPNNNSGKELVIFRDSFGSSITPLLVEYYSKITVIDNRYITSKYFLEHIGFNNQDILFLYSTLIVNNSVSLKG